MSSQVNTIFAIPNRGLCHAICLQKLRNQIAPNIVTAFPFDQVKKRVHPQACCVLCEKNIHIDMTPEADDFNKSMRG